MPPGGWRFTVPETGLLITGATPKVLTKKVRSHMEANSIEIPEPFREWFEDALCVQMNLGPKFCGRPAPVLPKGVMKGLTLGTAARFLRTMMKVLEDREFVGREEAESRVAICNSCPISGGIGGCAGCNSILNKVDKLLQNDPLPVDPDKEYCLACGCKISLKCWIPNSTLDKAETERPDYWEKCWRHELPTPDSPKP